MNTIYIGWDSREALAYRVAAASIAARSSSQVQIKKLDAQELYRGRMLWRPVERDGGTMRDHMSGAPQSTEFATSRFLLPFIHRTGWALFCDLDIVCLGDVDELFALAESRYAVMCVQHPPLLDSGTKMDGQAQLPYPRKNWSSVMLVNCDHVAHHRMPLALLNQWPGALLHRFSWLRDEEIGALPPEWNWLVGVQDKPAVPKLAHFTLGGPWLPGWAPHEHDEIWLEAARLIGPARAA